MKTKREKLNFKQIFIYFRHSLTNGQVGLELWPRYTLDETAGAISSLPMYMSAEFPRVTICIHSDDIFLQHFICCWIILKSSTHNISSVFKVLEKITILKSIQNFFSVHWRIKLLHFNRTILITIIFLARSLSWFHTEHHHYCSFDNPTPGKTLGISEKVEIYLINI